MRANHAIIASGTLLLSTAALAAGGDLGQAVKQPTNWTAIGMFVLFVIGTLFITQVGRKEDDVRRRVLYGRWRHYGLPERPGDCRRLHVRGLVPWHFRGGLCQWL
ncbi:hypothetical protein ACTMU2_22345 [Cupriavidus basilensis]